MKRIIRILLSSCILVFFSCKKPIPKNSRIRVQSEVIKIFYSNSGSCRVKFKDSENSERIGYYIHKIPYLQIGEEYMMSYDKNDIDEIIVHFSAPIIKDSTNYIYSSGIVTWNHVNDFFNSNDCRFIYYYNGKRFKRFHRLVDKGVKKGDSVKILINKHRPYIAYVEGNNEITN